MSTRTLANLSHWPEDSTSRGRAGRTWAARSATRQADSGQRQRPDLCTLASNQYLRTVRNNIADIEARCPRTGIHREHIEMTAAPGSGPRLHRADSFDVATKSEISVARALLTQSRTALVSYAEPGCGRDGRGRLRSPNQGLQLARNTTWWDQTQLAYMNTLSASVFSPGTRKRCWGCWGPRPAHFSCSLVGGLRPVAEQYVVACHR